MTGNEPANFKRLFIDESLPFPFRSMDEFHDTPVEQAYDRMESQAWIDTVRTPSSGPLLMYATAEVIGIPLQTVKLRAGQGKITGLDPTKAEPVVISIDESDDEPVMTFGHEVGHAFLELARNSLERGFGYAAVENFCELFGFNMGITLEDVSKVELTPSNIVLLSLTHKVSIANVIRQFMRADLLPDRVATVTRYNVDGGNYFDVVCKACMEGQGCGHERMPQFILDFRDHEMDYSGSCWSKYAHDEIL